MTALSSRFPLGGLQCVAALVPCVRPRRVPPRRAGNFHLLAQMKVTREPGRDPAGCSPMHQAKLGAAPNQPVQPPAGSLKGSTP